MEGLNVFLTGCGRGVGAALALALRERGAVVFAGFHPGETGHTEPLVQAASLIPVPMDVADPASVAAAAALVGSRTRALDILLNVAGVLGDITTTVPGMLDERDIHRTYDVNAVGPLRVINAFFPLLLGGRTRLVVSISSEAGSISTCTRTGWFGYCMSKAALNMASAIVHNILRPLGGRVIVMHPGWVRTWMSGTLDTAADLSPREAAEGILSQVDRALEDPALFAGERPSFIDGKGGLLSW